MRHLLAGGILLSFLSVGAVAVKAQDDDHRTVVVKKYYDRTHHDSHEWNDDENARWARYREEHRIREENFERANRRQQQAYWNWRHEHPDHDHDNR